jgi:LAO/AO transport system kinase
MGALAGDPGVFIRSMATRGSLGGLAAASVELADLLDAQGRQLILVETVGVGQSELEVARAADTTVVVLTPESGDGIQAMMAGLLEAGDVFVVNKADRGGADKLRRSLEATLSWRELPDGAWRPPVLNAAAVKGEGVTAVADAVAAHRAHLQATGAWDLLRRERWRTRVRSIVNRRLARRLWGDPETEAILEQALADGARSPYEAADAVLDSLVGPAANG